MLVIANLRTAIILVCSILWLFEPTRAQPPEDDPGSQTLAPETTETIDASHASNTQEDLLQKAFGYLAEERFEDAANMFSSFIASKTDGLKGPAAVKANFAASPTDSQRLTLAMVGAGQALRQLGNDEAALEFFEAALQRGDSLRGEQAVRLAAANCAAQLGRHPDVLRLCTTLLEMPATDPQQSEDAQRLYFQSLTVVTGPEAGWDFFNNRIRETATPHFWLDSVLGLGFQALQKQSFTVAINAFRWCSPFVETPAKQEMLDLGLALSIASAGESENVAVNLLTAFAEKYPTSVYLPRTLLARAILHHRNGQLSDAAETYGIILKRFPNSPEAATALEAQLVVASAERVEGVVEGVSVPTLIGMLERPRTSAALFLAICRLSPQFNDKALQKAIAVRWQTDRKLRDESPQLLGYLAEQQQSDLAEQIATGLIENWIQPAISVTTHKRSPNFTATGQSGATTAPAVQALNLEPALTLEPAIVDAFRWLASGGDWQLIGTIAELHASIDFHGDEDGLVMRLLGEGAFQAGNTELATYLFDQMIASSQEIDFDTLLRRAELALARESKAEAAEWIRRAGERVTASTDAALVAILQAQWLIRDTRMDQARLALDSMMRTPEVSAELKARAKWMRGETFFLQKRYADAINEYREVGAIDTGGYWASAALLQSGRAFEQLSRPRDATICYTALMNNDKVGPFADEAKRRLTELGSTADKRQNNR